MLHVCERKSIMSTKKTAIALVAKELDLPNGLYVPEDTTIVVDLANMVGYWQGMHFDVSPEEICLLN